MCCVSLSCNSYHNATDNLRVDNPSTPIAPLLALLTLSPFFLFSSYATIILINRPLSGLNILLGQLANEVFNGILKRRLRGVRPGALGEGYGMPSSHSQVSTLRVRLDPH